MTTNASGSDILADERAHDNGTPADAGDLDKRIAAAKAATTRAAPTADSQAETRGWAVGIEFVGTVLVAGFIGWAIDRYAGLGTAPFAMIALLFLGFIAGTRRALQTSAQFDADPNSGH